MSKVFVNDRGERWCSYRRKAKRVFDTCDDAWLMAFVAFATRGMLLTPYRCGRTKIHTGIVRTRITGNPYAFNPYRHTGGTEKIERGGCGWWHLTSATSHALCA